MPPQDTIHLLNVASSAPQASRAFFAPMRRVVARPGCWFETLGVEVVEVRDPRARRQQARQQNVKPLQDTIRFKGGIECVSGHSDADSQEGLNLLAGFMDEVDAFKSRAELAKLRGNALRESPTSAESVLAMLQTSASPQPLDALVLTPSGWKRMGDVQAGDRVVDPEGSESVVEGVYPQGKQPVYRLTFSDGTSAEATGSHRWAVDRSTVKRAVSPGHAWYREIVTTEDLRRHLLSGSTRPVALPDAPALRHLDFPQEDGLFIDPYLLGLLLGAGGLTHVTPQFTTGDAELADAVRELLPSGMRLTVAGHSGNATMFNLVNGKGKPNPLTQELKRLGVWGKKPPEKFVPWQYKYARAETRLAVLQGLMDTGGRNAQGNMGEFSSVSEALRDDVTWLARSLGLKAVKWKDEESPAGPAERMSRRERRSAGITLRRLTSYSCGIEEIPGTRLFRLPRKLRARRGGRRFRRRLVSVEFAGEAECQCIAVSAPSRLYITDDFIPTHNTRFPEVYKVARISYPRYLGSTIQKLRARGEADIEAKGAASRHYVSGPKATWEVNPRVPGRHVFREDYEEDPVMAAAKYECRPSRAVNPYFANMTAVEACLEEHPDPPLQVAYVRDMAAWKPAYSFAERLYPVRGAAYAMHADMARSRDRAGIALAHVARWEEASVTGYDSRGREVEVRQPRPVVKVDFSIAFEADIAASPPREIQVRWGRDLCLELIRRGFSVRRFTMDGWQSVDSLQILEAHGIDTDRVSTDLSEDPWRTLRDLAYEDRLRGWKDPLLVTELAGLSKLPNGRIDHPADGSKDVADAVACACAGAVLLGGAEDPSGARAYLSSGWPQPEPLGEMPAGMPPGLRHLGFESELGDGIAPDGPAQAGGPGWLFPGAGESYSGSV